MKILILGYVWPEPNSSAAGTRIIELINAFNHARWQVCFASPATPTEHQIDLTTLGVETFASALNCASFNRFVADLAPDIVIFDRFITEEQFGWRVSESCPSALRVLDTEDLHSLRAAREMLHKRQQQNSAPGKHPQPGPVLARGYELYSAMREQDMVLREVAAIFRCDLSLMISDVEQRLLQDFFSVPAYLLYHLPFMVTPRSSPTPEFNQREHFISLGNFKHKPNWDAVLWLKHELWPLIRAQLPAAELHIYGAYPPPKATQLHNRREGFLVKGWANSAREVLDNARVCLAPLRFGAGIKGKLIDSMQSALPSVTTRIGAEAMTGAQAWPGAVADSAEDFATAAVKLYREQALWQQACERGAAIVAERYHEKHLAPRLIAHLTALHKNLAEHRQRNFLGAMVNHHSLRSTEFMSRWIEAKSR